MRPPKSYEERGRSNITAPAHSYLDMIRSFPSGRGVRLQTERRSPVAFRQSVYALLRRYRRHVVRERLQMDRPGVEADAAGGIKPAECMLEPILVIPLRKVLPRMCTAAFRPTDRRVKADARLGEHVV